MNWLADSVLAALEAVPGSPEREHVTALLRQARRIRLDDTVAAAVSCTIGRACASIERHLDHLMLRSQSTWVECDHLARAAHTLPDEAAIDPRLPQTVGCLVACDPANPAHIAVFAAWRTSLGAVHHSFAMLHWDRHTFIALAEASNGHDDAGASERLLNAVSTIVPPGFADELEIMQGTVAANDPRRDEALLQTQRDVTGEHLFLLAALLLLETPAIALERAPTPPPRQQQLPIAPNAPMSANDNEALDPVSQEAETETEADHWVAQIGRPARRWPWSRGGFTTTALGGDLAWSPPRST